MQRSVFLFLLAGCLLSGVWLAFSGYRFVSTQADARARIAEHLQSQTLQSARRIDETFLQIQQLAAALANDITDGRVAWNDIPAKLQETAVAHPDFLGVVAAFQPFAFDPDKRLHAPYCVRREGNPRLVQVEDSYDYTQPGHDWFNLPLTKGAMWLEPFFGQASDALLAMYCAPFYKAEPASGTRTLVGVLGITVSLGEVNRIVNQLDLGSVGYGTLVSAEGRILSHPVTEWVKARKKLSDLADELGNAKLKTAAELGGRGQTGILENVPTGTGRNAVLAFAPLQATGWTLLTHGMQDESDSATIARRRQTARVLFAGMAFAMFVMFLATRVHHGGQAAFWRLAAILSVLFVAGISCFWYVATTSNSYLNLTGTKLAERASLKRYLEVLSNTLSERHQKMPGLRPTGVLLRSVELTDAHNVRVKGLVWQSFSPSAPPDSEAGFLLQDATDVEIREAYREQVPDRETVGWEFVATIPQFFRYNRYPLNRECITLRIAPRSPLDPVLLVPDLDSYKYLTPSMKPGLEDSVHLPGWAIEKSFFEYQKTTPSTTLGLLGAADAEALPQLCFSVVIRNNVVNSCLSTMTPILVVFALLFAMVMTITKDETHAHLMEFGMSTMITNGSCLFFIIILSHIEMRAHLVSQGLMYLEYFYVLQYLVILLTCLDAYLFIRFPGIRILQYRDHLVVKALFCPVCLGLLFLVTALTFY